MRKIIIALALALAALLTCASVLAEEAVPAEPIAVHVNAADVPGLDIQALLEELPAALAAERAWNTSSQLVAEYDSAWARRAQLYLTPSGQPVTLWLNDVDMGGDVFDNVSIDVATGAFYYELFLPDMPDWTNGLLQVYYLGNGKMWIYGVQSNAYTAEGAHSYIYVRYNDHGVADYLYHTVSGQGGDEEIKLDGEVPEDALPEGLPQVTLIGDPDDMTPFEGVEPIPADVSVAATLAALELDLDASAAAVPAPLNVALSENGTQVVLRVPSGAGYLAARVDFTITNGDESDSQSYVATEAVGTEKGCDLMYLCDAHMWPYLKDGQFEVTGYAREENGRVVAVTWNLGTGEISGEPVLYLAPGELPGAASLTRDPWGVLTVSGPWYMAEYTIDGTLDFYQYQTRANDWVYYSTYMLRRGYAADEGPALTLVGELPELEGFVDNPLETPVYATLALAGVDPAFYLAMMPEAPTIADGVITLPDDGYRDVVIWVGDGVFGELEDGVWTLDCTGEDLTSPWIIMYAYRNDPAAYNNTFAWELADGALRPINMYANAPGESTFGNGISMLLIIWQEGELTTYRIITGLVSALYDPAGNLTTYSYGTGDPNGAAIYYSADGTLIDVYGDDPDPEKYPPLTIIEE